MYIMLVVNRAQIISHITIKLWKNIIGFPSKVSHTFSLYLLFWHAYVDFFLEKKLQNNKKYSEQSVGGHSVYLANKESRKKPTGNINGWKMNIFKVYRHLTNVFVFLHPYMAVHIKQYVRNSIMLIFFVHTCTYIFIGRIELILGYPVEFI